MIDSDTALLSPENEAGNENSKNSRKRTESREGRPTTPSPTELINYFLPCSDDLFGFTLPFLFIL